MHVFFHFVIVISKVIYIAPWRSEGQSEGRSDRCSLGVGKSLDRCHLKKLFKKRVFKFFRNDPFIGGNIKAYDYFNRP